MNRENVQEVLPAIMDALPSIDVLQQIELGLGLVLCLWDSLMRFL